MRVWVAVVVVRASPDVRLPQPFTRCISVEDRDGLPPVVIRVGAVRFHRAHFIRNVRWMLLSTPMPRTPRRFILRHIGVRLGLVALGAVAAIAAFDIFVFED